MRTRTTFVHESRQPINVVRSWDFRVPTAALNITSILESAFPQKYDCNQSDSVLKNCSFHQEMIESRRSSFFSFSNRGHPDWLISSVAITMGVMHTRKGKSKKKVPTTSKKTIIKRAPPGSLKKKDIAKRKLGDPKVSGYKCGRCGQPKVGHTCTIELVHSGKVLIPDDISQSVSETRVQKQAAKSELKVYKCKLCGELKRGHECKKRQEMVVCKRVAKESDLPDLEGILSLVDAMQKGGGSLYQGPVGAMQCDSSADIIVSFSAASHL
jgi:hypothetical protein